MSATGKKTKPDATSGKATRRQKQAPQKLSEQTKELTLKAFRMTYEAHQRERDEAMKETATPPSSNGKRQGKAKTPARKKELTANEATLRAWKKTYENRHRPEKAPAR